MPFLKDIGLSASTAANYMRIAKEVSADSKMATLPYTKILALLAAPPEEREELAAAAEDMSAAEIRRLTEERNRAAEAANSETMRADQAEKEAKKYYDEIAHLHTKIQSLEAEVDEAYQRGQDETVNRNREMQETIDVLRVAIGERDEEIDEKCKIIGNHLIENGKLKEQRDELKAKLLEAENHVIEVEKAPADYEQMKREREELIAAAAEAEERAAEAEAALEELRNENAQSGVSDFEKMHFALRSFLMQCEHMALQPVGLYRDAEKALKDVGRLRLWCDTIEKALNVQNAEGAVL